MEKIIDGVLTVAYLFLASAGGGYTLHSVYSWSRNATLEKAATRLGSLEKSNRIINGRKLDF